LGSINDRNSRPIAPRSPSPSTPCQSATMNKYLAGTLTVLFWIGWPIYIVLYYIAITILAILKVIYWPIAFVLQPVVYLLRFIAACLALPFRALVKLEVRSLNGNICTNSYLTLSTPASVQLPRSCSTGRRARRPGTLLHIQDLPPPPPARFRTPASPGTHCQTIPARKGSIQCQIRAASLVAAEPQQRHGRQSPQRPR
jgi:hypothetical protein